MPNTAVLRSIDQRDPNMPKPKNVLDRPERGTLLIDGDQVGVNSHWLWRETNRRDLEMLEFTRQLPPCNPVRRRTLTGGHCWDDQQPIGARLNQCSQAA